MTRRDWAPALCGIGCGLLANAVGFGVALPVLLVAVGAAFWARRFS